MKPNPYQQFLENVERWDAEQKAEKADVPQQAASVPGSDSATPAAPTDLFAAARHEENCQCRVCCERPSRHE